MPSKYITKQYAPDSYYHVFNRGVAKQNIFVDDKDYATFLNLLKRHLSNEPSTDKFGRLVAKLNEDIDLLAFCLMPNHFHLLVYNISEQGIVNLMRRAMTAYSMYFNKRHKRVGTLFQNTYKASLILDDAYLWHISRYIHLNPQDIGQDYKAYPYSSYQYYAGNKTAQWVHPAKILELHENDRQVYTKFVADYEESRKDLQELKHQLADT